MTNLRTNGFKVALKVCEQIRIGTRTDIKAINRAIANHAPWLFPVTNNDDAVFILSFISEKSINIIDDNDIDV